MNKKDKIKIIIIIILILLLGVIIGFTIIKKMNSISNNTVIPNNNIIDNEAIISDEKLKESFDILTQKKWDGLEHYIIDDLFKKDIIDNLSTTDKLYLILEWNYKHHKELITDEFINNYNSSGLSKKAIGLITDDNGNYTNYDNEYYIKERYIKDSYNTLFTDNYEEIKIDYINNCPAYFYDSNYNIYFYAMFCGGTGFYKDLLYVYKTENIGNIYNIYVAVGYESESDDNDPNTETWKYNVYKSYITNEIYITISENEMYNYKIDKSNYNEFDHFKLSFEKNNEGNYLFKSVEKI